MQGGARPFKALQTGPLKSIVKKQGASTGSQVVGWYDPKLQLAVIFLSTF